MILNMLCSPYLFSRFLSKEQYLSNTYSLLTNFGHLAKYESENYANLSSTYSLLTNFGHLAKYESENYANCKTREKNK